MILLVLFASWSLVVAIQIDQGRQANKTGRGDGECEAAGLQSVEDVVARCISRGASPDIFTRAHGQLRPGDWCANDRSVHSENRTRELPGTLRERRANGRRTGGCHQNNGERSEHHDEGRAFHVIRIGVSAQTRERFEPGRRDRPRAGSNVRASITSSKARPARRV